MTHRMKIGAVTVLSLASAACSHNAALRSEIGQIEDRLRVVEGEITAGTSEIGQPGKDVRTRIAYRPFQAWADGFGTKTIAFRQKDKGGDLDRQSKKCVVLGVKRPAYRVFIHEDKSTKMDLKVGPLAVQPTDTGLNFASKFDVWAKTQFAAAGRPPCIGGWSPTVSAGAEVNSYPKTVLNLSLTQSGGMQPHYSVKLTSPSTLDLEFRTGIDIPHVGDFDIRHTFRPKIGEMTLMSGDLDLLVDSTSEIVMPGGETRVYKLATVDPAIITDKTGMGFETDVSIEREGEAVATGEAALPNGQQTQGASEAR